MRRGLVLTRFVWQAKSSVVRGIKNQIVSEYPSMEAVFEELWPKKAVVEVSGRAVNAHDADEAPT